MPTTNTPNQSPLASTLSSTETSDPLLALRGKFLIGSRCRNDQGTEQDVSLGWLTVRPAEEEADAPPGQWTLQIVEEHSGNTVSAFFVRVASRLGILPIRLASNFAAALANDRPMAMVADTNALRYGLLSQALRARGDRATHVAVADQAYMEIHRQREVAYEQRNAPSTCETLPESAHVAAPNLAKGDSTPPALPDEVVNQLARWRRAADRCVHLVAAARALRRVRDEGYLVHVARPPDAKVRYLGGSAGAASADDEKQGAADGASRGNAEVASNLVRDRLVLEAAFQQMVELPSIPVWLVTSDALLAEQADMEGLSVGFGWLADRLEPGLITSPAFDPRTLNLCHVPLRDLLEEIVWSCGVVTLQKEEEGKRLVGSVPSGSDKRWRALAALAEPGHGVRWKQETAQPRSASSVNGHPSVRAEFPRKAPPPQVLLNRLLSQCSGKPDVSREPDALSEAEATADTYLRGLGWIEASGGGTERGRSLVEKWLRLKDADAESWVDWMYNAARDIGQISILQKNLGRLQEKPGATDSEIASATGDSKRTVQAQLGFASAFGIAIRLGNKTWRAAVWNDDDAIEAVFEAIRVGTTKSAVGTASLARTFTSFLAKTEAPSAMRPMSIPVFRRALIRLRAQGRVHFGGSSPENSEVKIRVLVPEMNERLRVENRPIDLGYGDFLLPGTTCAAATLPEGKK